MTQQDLQKILMKCFYGDIDNKEAFKLINEDREKLLQEIANLKREKKRTEQQIKILYANSSSEYHNLRLSRIINEFDMTIVDDEKDIPWPDPLDYSKINTPKEKLDQNFKDGIRYIQG